MASFGAFVEIAEASKAYATTRKPSIATAADSSWKPGVEHDFKIIKMNPTEKKVGLSIRAVGEEATRSEVEAYKQPRLFHRRLDHWRIDVVEARQQRSELAFVSADFRGSTQIISKGSRRWEPLLVLLLYLLVSIFRLMLTSLAVIELADGLGITLLAS